MALFLIAPNWKQLKWSSADEQTELHPHNRVLFIHKKAGSIDKHCNRDEFQRHYAAWMKLEDIVPLCHCTVPFIWKAQQSTPVETNHRWVTPWGGEGLQTGPTDLFWGQWWYSEIRLWWRLHNAENSLQIIESRTANRWHVWHISDTWTKQAQSKWKHTFGLLCLIMMSHFNSVSLWGLMVFLLSSPFVH